LITGKKPPTTRQTVSWAPIWKNGDHEIYDAGYMFNSCATGNFNQYAVIVYDDPHLNSEYEDGIDNFYNIGKDNPYETLIGYAHYMYWPGWDTDKDAVISKSDTARILIKLPTNSLGTLHKRPNANDATSSNPACYQGMTGEQLKYSDGVPVPLPEHFRYESVRGTTVDKFSGISGVFVVGQEISDMRGVAPTPADQDTDNFDIEVSLNHLDSYTSSSIKLKTVMKDKSHHIFTGNLNIPRTSLHVTASQLNNNLVLDKTSRAESMPKLEVFADDVKCSHGATMSEINEDQLFYLMSRGLTLSDSRHLIVEGFITEILDKLKSNTISQDLKDKFLRKIGF
jgi:hypothetical protein